MKHQILYYHSDSGIGAVDLDRGRLKWSRDWNGYSSGSAIDSRNIYGLEIQAPNVRLSKIDLQTGASETIKSFEAESADIAAFEGRVYLLVNGEVQCIDSANGVEIWKTGLYTATPESRTTLSTIVVDKSKVYVGVSEVAFFCLDSASGTMLWKGLGTYSLYNPPIVTDLGIITWFNDVQLRDAETGTPIWTFKDDLFQPSAVVGATLIGRDGGAFSGLDVSSGKLLWKWQVDDDKGITFGGPGSPSPSDSNGVIVNEEALMYIAKDGKKQWSLEGERLGYPVYADASMLLCVDSQRLFAYVSGNKKPIPSGEAERITFADKLLTDFDLLDGVEEQDLITLREHAFAPLLDKFVAWANQYNPRAASTNRRLSSNLGRAIRMLEEMALPEDTAALLKALEALPESFHRGQLEDILIDVGDEQLTMPHFIEKLRKSVSDDSYASDELLESVARSSHPEAVAFMLSALKDRSAPAAWRFFAFAHLAGTGGEEGVAAVRAARPRAGVSPTWQFQFYATTDKRNVISSGFDSAGREWRLVQNSALGNYGDLFLQQVVGDGYGQPIFLGVDASEQYEDEEPRLYKGVRVDELVKTEWLKLFPGDPAFLKDTDNDGLTDLVEARLGTNPAMGDSDGDRIGDAYDRCPNAPRTQLNDRQKVVAAAIDARFLGSAPRAPATIRAEGIPPFEVNGYNGRLIWITGKEDTRLDDLFGKGVQSISIFGPEDEETEGPTDTILFYDGGLSAKCVIWRSSGPLSGDGYEVTLRKFGDEWLVVGMTLRYVS